MTAAAIPALSDERHDAPSGPIWLLRDSWTEMTRHLRAFPRNPDVLIFAAIQPIMFVLLFVYVFGGSIGVPGGNYKQYVIPGIFTQITLFGSGFTGVGVAEDLTKGIIDRLRSLPMSHAAVLVGRTLSDLVRNLFTFAVMFVVAFAVGFRLNGGFADSVAATLLLVFFAYAFSWVQALIGLSVSSVETANSAGFIWMFPMTFISSAFVPTENMPTVLETIADVNPYTVVTNAVRSLYNGESAGNDVWISLLWATGITVVFAALAIRKFEKSTSR